MKDSMEHAQRDPGRNGKGDFPSLSSSVSRALEDRSRMEDLHEARRRFLEDGTILDTVRPVVRDAWRRCKEYGIDPNKLRRQIQNLHQLRAIQAVNRELLESADPIVEFVRKTLANSPYIFFLADRNGVVLRVSSHPSLRREELADQNVLEGASRHERDVGCSGRWHCPGRGGACHPDRPGAPGGKIYRIDMCWRAHPRCRKQNRRGTQPIRSQQPYQHVRLGLDAVGGPGGRDEAPCHLHAGLFYFMRPFH